MSGRCRVEDHVVETGRHLAAGQQLGELVERGDLRRAGAGKLFFHPLDGIVRQNVAHRPDDPIAIGLRRRLRVDVENEEAGHVRDGGRLVLADLDAEDLPEIRGGIGADEQHSLPAIGQGDGDRTRQRRLADAPFAGEEQVPCGGVGKDHGESSVRNTHAAGGKTAPWESSPPETSSTRWPFLAAVSSSSTSRVNGSFGTRCGPGDCWS